MTVRKEAYYYNKQLTKYILQFMAIFTDMQVQVGKNNIRDEAFVTVPIHYGFMDRVVAAIFSDNTQNKPLGLPVMSAYMRDLQLDEQHFHGVGMERRQTFVPVGGLVPDDIQVVHQRMPLQCIMTMELGIYASNSDQMFQMLEQILPLFNPQLTIQTSEGVLDWTRMTSCKLETMSMNPNYPIGTSRRIVQSVITFTLPIYIDTPADVRRNFIEKVFIRVGNVSSIAEDSYEILAELDAQGIDYDLVSDTSDLKID